MNKVRELMIECGQNIEWCKPMKHESEDITLCVKEGEVIVILECGNEIYPVTAEKITELAKRLNSDYDMYEGWDDTHILLDSGFEEMGCKDCPWFDTCEAMHDDE